MHQMVLTYSVSIAEPGDFTVRLPPFNSQVYDGVTESQLLMVHDSNRRTLLVSDIYPEKVELAKGDHTVRVELRHESPAVLEKHRDLTLVLERKLGSAVDVPVYPDPIEMATGGKTYKGQDMHRAERQRVVVGLPAADKLPKDASEGRVLVGHVQWGTSDEPIGKDEIRYVGEWRANREGRHSIRR